MKKLALLLPLCLAAPALCAEFSLKGYFKTYAYSVEPADLRSSPADQPDGPYAALENKLRLKAGWGAGRLKAEAAYELVYSARPGELARARPLTAGYGYRVSDPEPFLSPAAGGEDRPAALIQNLDRAYLTWSPPAFDLYAGRQPLAFGSGRAVNPTDILAPYPFGTIDTEERRGVDALRLKVPNGEMGEFDAGWLPGRRWAAGEGAGFLRARDRLADADLTLLAAAFRGNLMAGADIEREWGGAMLRAEAARVWTGSFGGRVPGEDFDRLTAGAEYNFGLLGGTDAWLEYHYNGAGAAGPAGYAALAAKTAYREANVYLLGRHYLAGGAGAQVSALVSAGLAAMLNLGDGSLYVTPSLDWNAAENLYIGAGALLPSGRRARYNGLSASPDSEFGLYDRSLYAAARFYF
ncbi:MAG TPA: hypothetical protein DCW72_01495 [Elusimicrobia bacterium]|nr:MAG: hypothetical protein A2X29_09825 [Elusimicrobia bacterium GWA2_64_40]OGR65485.1 MAG: hypothetical protein A2X30_08195 [Elusimicrobia bacterium GWB2_63_16]HAN04556.1 hypothetical protein [Elusimicrobiota bacterium]HAU88941.1 hypothetical protein [Elusimicrobiota bacterium]